LLLLNNEKKIILGGISIMKFLNNPIWLVLLIGILVLSVVLTGCDTTNTPTASIPATTTTQTTTTATQTPTPAGLTGSITESGSTSVQPLAEALADAFTTKNPNAKVTIQGGGSSVGIKAATDGTVNIGASSRELTEAEAANLKEFVLCKDGIAIIVHPSNGVSNLTKDQVKNIFAGTITNWKDVGGADKAIHVAAREEGSGTRGAFEELVMGKETKIVSTAILQSSNGALRQVVQGDADAIGFLSFGYLDASIKALNIAGVTANTANVLNGSYPISRPFLLVTKGEPAGLTKAFIDYCLSAEVQSIITDEGYISIK
jgi:phosphate transport system substrate-binding protein